MRSVALQYLTLLAFLVLPMLPSGETPSDAEAVASGAIVEFDNLHTTVGNAVFVRTPEGLSIQPTSNHATSGVSIAIGQSKALNAFLRPIEMPTGTALTATVRGVSGQKLASIIHVQKTATTTELYLDMSEVSAMTVGPVNLETLSGGVSTHTSQIAGLPMQKIGTVESTVGAWAKSYHVLCEDGECTVFIDPDDTTITLEEGDGRAIPFNYLKLNFALGFDPVPSALELVGTGLPPILLVGESVAPLIF